MSASISLLSRAGEEHKALGVLGGCSTTDLFRQGMMSQSPPVPRQYEKRSTSHSLRC